MSNPILRADSYKLSHWRQYPGTVQFTNSYIEARKGDTVTFFGLQAFLMEYLMQPVNFADVEEARAFAMDHGLPFNHEGFSEIARMGHWPVYIEAVPEGLEVPISNVLLQIRNTDPRFPWVPSFLETALLRGVWYPTTVATNSRDARRIILANLVKTADDPKAEIDFKMHDFGARGVSSSESAELGGMAHLVNFNGTDTMEGVIGARRFYGEKMAGFSIPAAEHSTMTSWGKDRETVAYKNMLLQFQGSPLVAVVSDSYDIWNAVSNIWGGTLAEDVKNFGGTVVIRPDSGDPITVPIMIVATLMEKFGYTVNSKGYKVLPPYLRVIQGDGINKDTIRRILVNAEQNGQSGSNFAFGQGGGLLQAVTRDTFGFAMKASAVLHKGDTEWTPIRKQPVTDNGKASKAGILKLVKASDAADDYETTTSNVVDNTGNVLRRVYENGRLYNWERFTTVRNRARS